MTHHLIDELERTARTDDPHAVMACLEQCYQAVLENDMELINTIIEPRVITSLHQRLIERLNIPPRAMMLKKRVPPKKQRALMFIKAMQNGVRRAQ